jgi:hypothetical protein
MDKGAILDRIDFLSDLAVEIEAPAQTGAGLVQGVLSLFQILYGPGSAQSEDYLQRTKVDYSRHSTGSWANNVIIPISIGVLRNLRAEVEADMIRVRERIAGEVLGDFLIAARAALDDGSPGTVNVAAVLTAAAFEDTLRRIGSELAGITKRIRLEHVVTKLKEQGILEGPQVGIAQSYLKFRNDALHADWGKIGRESVSSCLGFVEALLLKHFS